MSDQNHQAPRKASTGSYTGQRSGGNRPAGSYRPGTGASSETRPIRLGEKASIKRRGRTTPETVAHNAEKERFDFAELFSKKNVKRFTKHLIFYFVLVTISVLITYCVVVAANDINAFIKEDETIVVTIPQGASVDAIGTILEDNGVIDSKLAWKGYCKFKKSSGFQYGEYELNSNMCYKEIITELRKSSKSRETAKITIPEGYEQREIVDLLVKEGYADRAVLEDVLANYEFDYDFVRDLPKRNNRLEGYLFPDTYEIFVGDEVSIVNTMLSNFQKKIEDEEMQKLLKKSKYTLDEIITMASIVEREGANNSEFGKVASVFYNRIESKTYPYLESCATVQYVLPERKSVLSIADTKMDNPYNTYQNEGLPPGPIACPGLDAIKAALDPEDTDYYFFVASPNGTLFAKTFSEHNANIRKAGNSSGGTSTVS
ncbi:MAG: endolytic transglycosylase MltG [Clostridia bacterium]|nr:endolytic transglycosylase MltG [Clostridia bacterium]